MSSWGYHTRYLAVPDTPSLSLPDIIYVENFSITPFLLSISKHLTSEAPETSFLNLTFLKKIHVGFPIND